MSNDAEAFADKIEWGRGFFPDVPLVTQPAVGDGAIAGRNVIFSRYGEVRSWRGVSPLNSAGARRLDNVGGKIGGLESGNIWKQFGNATFFVGSGDAFVEDFTAKIGTANSQLQVRIGNNTYQAGLPKSSAPELSIAVDAVGQPIVGQVTGGVSAALTRIRSTTGAESAESDTSNVVIPTSGRIRVAFPAALTAQGQDEWGLYLTRHNFGGIGPHFLYRQIPEAEIAPFAYAQVSAGPGDGSDVTFGGTSTTPASTRLAVIVLRPAASTLPSYVGSSFANTPGGARSIRVQKPVAMADGQYLTVMITFKAAHTIVPATNNNGSVTLSDASGVWMPGPVPLNPGAEKINVRQNAINTFQWKLQSDVSWSGSVSMATTTTVLGSTGIGIKWSAAVSSAREIGNEFTINLFSLIAPAGWSATPIEWQNNPESKVGIGIYGKILDSASGEFFEWTTSADSQMNALAVGWQDVDTVTAPTVQSNSNYFNAATNHHVTLPLTGPTATQLVTVWYTSDGSVADFTPDAGLTPTTDTNLEERAIDIDYSDDDLLDILAPKGVEPPPAATHGFPLGPLVVLLGVLDGTGILPSKPNQGEQFDIASDVTYLSPAEPVVRCEVSPYDGSVYIWTRNSLQTVVYTGDTVAPVLSRTIWNNTGIEGENAACISKNGVYAFTGRRGLSRYRGNLEPDTDFANEVSRYVQHWSPAATVMGYDPTLEAVAACHDKEILLYFENLGIWSVPLRIDLWNSSGTTFSSDVRIVGSITIENRLHFVIQQGADYLHSYSLVTFDIGLGADWFIRSVARHAGAMGQMKTIRTARLVANLSSSQDLEYYNAFGIHQQGTTLVSDSETIGGYAATRLLIPPLLLTQGNIRFEWTVQTPLNSERYMTFAGMGFLNRWGGSPTLPTTTFNSGSILAWRITSSGILEWYRATTGTVKGAVQAGDVIRIDIGANGATIFGYLIRNGVQVGGSFDFNYPAFSWSNWHGWKAGLVSGDAVLDMGRVMKINQTGGFRIYKNFGAERGLSNIYEKTYTEDGPKHYPWQKMMKTNTVLYNVEAFGSCADQLPSMIYLDGYVPGRMHESLKTQ